VPNPRSRDPPPPFGSAKSGWDPRYVPPCVVSNSVKSSCHTPPQSGGPPGSGRSGPGRTRPCAVRRSFVVPAGSSPRSAVHGLEALETHWPGKLCARRIGSWPTPCGDPTSDAHSRPESIRITSRSAKGPICPQRSSSTPESRSRTDPAPGSDPAPQLPTVSLYSKDPTFPTPTLIGLPARTDVPSSRSTALTPFPAERLGRLKSLQQVGL
jgi:hypothetical protein